MYKNEYTTTMAKAGAPKISQSTVSTIAVHKQRYSPDDLPPGKIGK